MRVVFTGLRLRPPQGRLRGTGEFVLLEAFARLYKVAAQDGPWGGSSGKWGHPFFFRTKLSVSPSSHQRETRALQSGVHVLRNAGLAGRRAYRCKGLLQDVQVKLS